MKTQSLKTAGSPLKRSGFPKPRVSTNGSKEKGEVGAGAGA